MDVWVGLPDVCGGEGFVLAGKEKLSVAELMFLFFTEIGLWGDFLLFFQVLCMQGIHNLSKAWPHIKYI